MLYFCKSLEIFYERKSWKNWVEFVEVVGEILRSWKLLEEVGKSWR